MRTVSMSGSLRGNVGKKDAKAARREGLVPCVLYGGTEQVHFTVSERSFKDVVFTPEACFIDLDLDGKKFQAILQDIQYHPVSDNILHADMLELLPDKAINMTIPIKITGVSPGVLRGGRLVQKMRRLKTRSLPEHMPEAIVISIDKLDINDSVKVSDLQRDHLTLLDPKNAVVVGVRVTRVVEEPKVGEAPAAAPAAAAGAAEKPAEADKTKK
jgi:large subunit ribosomal protein L25